MSSSAGGSGAAEFPFDFDLGTDISPSSGATIIGALPLASTGVGVSSAGDVNGDGFDDVIIGAPTDGVGYGAAYVVFGSATGIPDTDLDSLAATDGFRIDGGYIGSQTGLSVASAGDVNGDGFDDVIVGAPYADGYDDGAAYLIFGKAGGFTNIDLASLAPADGFTIFGVYEGYGGTGFDVSSGDVNGDGFSDLIVGAPHSYNVSDDYPGAAYVIFGKDGDPLDFDDIDLGALDPADGFAIVGDFSYDHTGQSVATADVNGDGFADMLVGATGNCGCAGPGGTYYGKVWVIFGKETGLTDIDLASLTPADGFVISGAEGSDATGYSVASAGDINGDGYDEIVIGAPYGSDDRGTAYVIYGKPAGGFTDIDLAALNPADGFAIHGAAEYDYAGITVSGAGDINGDGFADVIIGAPLANYYTGASFVIFGKAGGFTDIDLAALTAADGFVIHGEYEGDNAGSVSSAGDVDGDGFDDLIIGAPGGSGGGYSSGQAYIIYGRGVKARDDAFIVDEDQTSSGHLFNDNGSGFDQTSRAGGTFAITEVDGVAASVGTQVTLTSGALLTVNADGTFDYDPNGAFDYLISVQKGLDTGAVNISATETFNYTITGGTTATVTITVNGVNSAGDELWGDSGANDIEDLFDDNFFRLDQGGNDTASGLGGDDLFLFGDAFTAADSVDGGANGAGGDTIVLDGDYFTVPLVLTATSLVNVERILVRGGFSYDITTHDDTVAAGEALIVNAALLSPLEELLFDGSAETDGRFLLIGGGCNDELIGGSGDDTLIGGAGSNMLDGGGGNDVVDYGSAAGSVNAHLGAGMASANGFGGSDLLFGIENLIGSDFNDVLTGDKFANILIGGTGLDIMTGGDGNDTYVVERPADQVIENGPAGGFDTVKSSISYTLGTDVERLVLTGTAVSGTGNSGINILIGNEVANILDGAAGADVMRGLGGDDTYYVDNVLDQVFEVDPADGFDTVRSSVSYALGSYQERLILTGAAAIDGDGNTLDNVLLGNSADNILNGGQGADQMRGGGGGDTYIVDNAGDTVTEISPADGMDTVSSSVTFSLGSYTEDLVLTGFAAIDGNGNTLVNDLTGNGGNNQLNGGAGADTMTGGAGDDTYIVDNIGDTVVETAGNGTDLVRSGVDHTLSASVENLTLTGSAVSGTGNGGANTITGNNAANTLSGAGSADTLFGSFGTDTLDGGLGNDKLYGGASSDDLTGGTGLDGFYFDAALNALVNVDDILDFTAADDTIFLDRAIFTGIGADGAIGAAAFRLGASAVDADDHILYDSVTGQIRYDADGIGGTAAILFATVTPGTFVTSADFIGYS